MMIGKSEREFEDLLKRKSKNAVQAIVSLMTDREFKETKV